MKQQASKDTRLQDIFNSLEGRFLADALMRSYTTIKIGGPAAGVYIPAGLDDLKKCILLCKKKNISLLPLGSGSNIIVTKKGLKNVFLKLSSKYFKDIQLCGNNITCGAGVIMNKLCDFAEENSLTGLEFLTGIPATAGGAVFQNAGAYQKDIASVLKSIECIDVCCNVRVLERRDIAFSYRHSSLEGFIILSARFNLVETKKRIIRNNTKIFLTKRLSSQDYTAPSAGCVFKNPGGKHKSAAEMIDSCGLKGKRCGDAEVSRKHANFIINKGKASAEDVSRLVGFIKKRVKVTHDVLLETEIKFIN